MLRVDHQNRQEIKRKHQTSSVEHGLLRGKSEIWVRSSKSLPVLRNAPQKRGMNYFIHLGIINVRRDRVRTPIHFVYTNMCIRSTATPVHAST